MSFNRSAKYLTVAIISMMAGMALRPYVDGLHDQHIEVIESAQSSLKDNAQSSVKPRIEDHAIAPAQPELLASLASIAEQYPVVFDDTLNSMEGYVLSRFFLNLCTRDPIAASDFLLSAPADQKREMTGVLARQWALQEPEALYLWIEHNKQAMHTSDYQMHLRQALAHLAKTNPERSIELLPTVKEQGDREVIMRSIAEGWIGKDYDLAFAWIEGLATSDASDHLLTDCYTHIMRGYIADFPEEASELVLQLDASNIHTQLAVELVRNWNGQDLKTLKSWMAKLDSPHSQESVITEYIRSHDDPAPDVFLDFVVNHPHVNEFATDTFESILNRVAKDNPTQAFGALRALPENAQAETTRRLIGHQLIQNHESTIAWFGELPDGVVRDAGAQAISHHYIESQPATAVTLAASIAEPELRQRTLRYLISSVDAERFDQVADSIAQLQLNASDRSSTDKALSDKYNNLYGSLVIP